MGGRGSAGVRMGPRVPDAGQDRKEGGTAQGLKGWQRAEESREGRSWALGRRWQGGGEPAEL